MASTDYRALTAASIGQALMAYFSAANANKNTKAELDQRASLNAQDVALRESTLDPWRSSMFQTDNAAKLDKLERGTYTPVNVSVNNKYAAQKPTVSGGYSYTKSPELTGFAGDLKTSILAGQGKAAPLASAPTADPASSGVGAGAMTGTALLSLLASNPSLLKTLATKLGIGGAATPSAAAMPTTFATGNGLGGTSMTGVANLPSGPSTGNVVMPGAGSAGTPAATHADAMTQLERELLKQMQNGGGGIGQYLAENPFGGGGGSSIEVPIVNNPFVQRRGHSR